METKTGVEFKNGPQSGVQERAQLDLVVWIADKDDVWRFVDKYEMARGKGGHDFLDVGQLPANAF